MGCNEREETNEIPVATLPCLKGRRVNLPQLMMTRSAVFGMQHFQFSNIPCPMQPSDGEAYLIQHDRRLWLRLPHYTSDNATSEVASQDVD